MPASEQLLGNQQQFVACAVKHSSNMTYIFLAIHLPPCCLLYCCLLAVPQCFMLPGNCVCKRLRRFKPQTKVVINLHPDEWGKGRGNAKHAAAMA